MISVPCDAHSPWSTPQVAAATSGTISVRATKPAAPERRRSHCPRTAAAIDVRASSTSEKSAPGGGGSTRIERIARSQANSQAYERRPAVEERTAPKSVAPQSGPKSPAGSGPSGGGEASAATKPNAPPAIAASATRRSL